MKIFERKQVYGLCVALLAAGMAAGLAWTPAAQAQNGPQARVIQAVRNDQLVALRGNVQPMARAANDRGALLDNQPVTRMQMLLQRSAAQESALEELLADQQDPKSPRFHSWLTPQQFGQQFGPADSDIQAVKDWLSSQGFSQLQVSNGRTVIQFNGTAGQVRNAFHTELHHLSVNGQEHFANMQDPQIPAALAPVVAGITGLNNFHPKPLTRHFGKFQRNARTGEITPLFTFTDVNGTFFGVGPADFKKIYNVPSGFDGTGVSIAVVGQSNINIQDARDFRVIFGLPANDPQIILNGPDPGLVSGDESESDLDVEWAGAIAPKATIKLVTSLTDLTTGVSGVAASALYGVDNDVAPILSMSYGLCEASLQNSGNLFYQLLWQQAAAEGITVIASAGDSGSAGCDDPNSRTSATRGIAVSGIASTPFNVAMGGTDFDQAGAQNNFWNPANGAGQISAKGYIPEIVWNDSCANAATSGNLTACANASANSTTSPLNIVGGGGAPSSIYAKPSFQSNAITGIPSDGKRDVPDISLFSADGGNPSAPSKSFYIVCESDADIAGDTGCNLTTFSANSPFHDFQAVGGTSAAAPTFAGMMALINQKTGQRQGNANITLYALAKNEIFANCNSSGGTSGSSSNTTCVFNDITKGNNSVPCAGASTNCSKTTSGGFGVLVSSGNPGFTAGLGYDLATGLGSLNVTNLVNAWTTAGATGTATTVTLNPAGGVNGTAGSVAGNLTGTVTGSGGTPTGVVILEDAATSAPLASAALSGGSYTLAAALLPQGTYSLKAHYSGDSTFAPKDSTSISVTLAKQNSGVTVNFVTAGGTITTAAQTVQYGSPYILRVDVAGAASGSCTDNNGNVVRVCPAGTVALKDGGNALNDFPNAQDNNASNVARLNQKGFAEDQPIQLNAGAHSITAAYTADPSSSYNSNAASNFLSVTITQAATTTAVTASPSSITAGGSVTLTATVSSNSNSAQGPTGTVQFLNGGANLGAAVTCTPAAATSTTGAGCTAQLSTTLSALPPGFLDPQPPRNTPFVIVTVLAAALALLCMLLAAKMAARRRQYAYAGVVFCLIAVAALAGCSGGSSSSSGGGSSRSITAKFSGDGNYAASTSSAVSVTVR